MLGGILLFQPSVLNGLTSAVISVGLDAPRSQLISALMMTAGSALIGAALGRRKLGAFVGAGIVFCSGFLIGFLQQQMHPILDPGGHPEPLSTAALVNNATMILGLGLLSAFIGLAIGTTFAEVVLDPPYRLLYYCVQKQRESRDHHLTISWSFIRRPSLHSVTCWCGAVVVVILIMLAANSSNLFIFSPDIGIHTHPTFYDRTGKVVTGTVISGSVISPSLKNQRQSFMVYLPPSYTTPQGKRRFYPTLYLLHGSPGKEIDWIVGGKAVESANTLIALGYISELIMVFPDGNGHPGATSEWGNSYDNQQLMENFVVNDLVKYIDQHYRTIPDAQHRAIGGLSMGGFGAMNIAIHHPDIIGSVISLGGYYKAEGTIWGQNIYYQQLNSPLNAILDTPQAWQLHMFLGAATKDQPYYQDTLQFMHELDHLHIRYHFDLEVGLHSWSIWQKQMYNALAWLRWLPWNSLQSFTS